MGADASKPGESIFNRPTLQREGAALKTAASPKASSVLGKTKTGFAAPGISRTSKTPPPPPVAAGRRSVPPPIPKRPSAAPGLISAAANQLPGGVHSIGDFGMGSAKNLFAERSVVPTAAHPAPMREWVISETPPLVSEAISLEKAAEEDELRAVSGSGSLMMHLRDFATDKRKRKFVGLAMGILLISGVSIALFAVDDGENAAPPEAAADTVALKAASGLQAQEPAAVAETSVKETAVAAVNLAETPVGPTETQPAKENTVTVKENSAAAPARDAQEKAVPMSQTKESPLEGSVQAGKAYQAMFGEEVPEKLPVTLSRDAVQAGMNRVANRVKTCSNKENRPIVMSVTIAQSGNVIDAAATGSFAGTDLGACVARIVRTATFPAAQQDMTVKYPFHF